MHKNIRSGAALGAAAVCLTMAAHATPTERFRVGHPQVLPQLAGGAPLGRLAPNTAMGVTISLALQNKAGLEQLIADQANPASPEFQRYLTPEQFGDRFGATQAQYDALKQYVESQGLTVTDTAPSRLTLGVAGPASRIEQAFSVQLNRYNVEGREVFANDRTPGLPERLGLELNSVLGLNNVLVARSHDSTQTYYTPFAINTIYNFTGIRTAGFDGTGQNIAILSLADYKAVNVNVWATGIRNFASPTTTVTFNPAHVVKVPVTNSGGSPNDSSLGTTVYSDEADLDTEICLGALPGATIQVWEAKNNEQSFYNIFSKFANQTAVKVLTSSWAYNEAVFLPTYTGDLDAFHALFLQAATQGLSIFNSTGDDGSRNAISATTYTKNVTFPPSDPYVVAVGGTTLTTSNNTANAYVSETAWGGVYTPAAGETNPPPYFGSGGGKSGYFVRPAWQYGGTGLPAAAPVLTTNAYNNADPRQLPDISLDADPDTGYIIYATDTSSNTAGYFAFGGTSASTPEWASATVLMQQALGKSFFLAPLLYKINRGVNSGAPFHDVKTGTNGDYNAGVGYDLVTGIGSADFTALKTALGTALNGTPPVPDDVNGDKTFDINDVVAALQIAGGLQAAPTASPIVGDDNTSHALDIVDAGTLLRKLTGLNP